MRSSMMHTNTARKFSDLPCGRCGRAIARVNAQFCRFCHRDVCIECSCTPTELTQCTDCELKLIATMDALELGHKMLADVRAGGGRAHLLGLATRLREGLATGVGCGA